MARNTSFIPATPPGEISKLIIATHSDDDAFRVLLAAQQASINLAYTSGLEALSSMFLRPLEVPTGPHAILAVMQAYEADEAQVVCMHALRSYILGSLVPVGTDPTLESRVFGFAGEIIVEDGMTLLPQCFRQPDHVETLYVPRPVRVPEEGALTAAFAIHDASASASNTGALMDADTQAAEVQLPVLLVIPTLLYPMFAMSRSPRATLLTMEAIVTAMPQADRPLFKRTIRFLQASCVKTGGEGGDRGTSRMKSAWTLAPSSSLLFNKWQRDTMKTLYSEAFARPGAGPMPLFGAGAAEAFGASLGTATTAAMEKLGDKLKEARADERRETEEVKANKSKWSELTQNPILRCHGHDATAEWNEQNVSEIWGLYQQAMKQGTDPNNAIIGQSAEWVYCGGVIQAFGIS
jgi:hypothetical protein